MRETEEQRREAERLKAEFLARGGEIKRLPMKGVRRADLVPQKRKNQTILDTVRARAIAARPEARD